MPSEMCQPLEHLPAKEDVCERLCCGEEGKYNPIHHPFDLLKKDLVDKAMAVQPKAVNTEVPVATLPTLP